MRAHLAPIAAAVAVPIFALLLVAPAAALKPGPATGDLVPGRYLLLLDAEGRALAGAYALADDLRITLRTSGDSVDMVFVDREFLPGHVASPLLFTEDLYTYDPAVDAAALAAGAHFEIERRWLDRSFDLGSERMREAPVERSVGTLALTVGGVASGVPTRIAYDLGGEAPQGFGEGADRAFFPEGGLDLSADLAARAVQAEAGAALSADDFIVLFNARSGSQPQAVSDCLLAARETDAYRGAATRLGTESDPAFAAAFADSGITYFTSDAYAVFRPLALTVASAACYQASPAK